VKLEFSSSDLVLALAIVNGTAARGAPSGAVDSSNAQSGEGDAPAERPTISGKAIGFGRPVSR
jgi:hypothetical protein